MISETWAEEMGPEGWAVVGASDGTPSKAWDVHTEVLPTTVPFPVVILDKLLAIERLRLYMTGHQ
jgi:hypothetical protein